MPIVIAHRGASGHRPEHTIAAYELAIEQGADFIEPDLVSTRDGVLVARHESDISKTTDVHEHPEFAARRTRKLVDGVAVTGFFTEDFTLAELKTLRAKERIPALRPHNCAYDGQFEVPTLAEIIALAQRASAQTGRAIGIYPETKQPSYFAAQGLALERPLVDALHGAGYGGRSAPVFIQSFELHNLVELRRLTDLPLIQLMEEDDAPFDLRARGDGRSYADLRKPRELARLASYVDGLGVHKSTIFPRRRDGSLKRPTSLVVDAHQAGLAVHAWTFRHENYFLPKELRRGEVNDRAFERLHGDLAAELALFFEQGIDGAFCDHPEVAVAARDALAGRRPA